MSGTSGFSGSYGWRLAGVSLRSIGPVEGRGREGRGRGCGVGRGEEPLSSLVVDVGRTFAYCARGVVTPWPPHPLATIAFIQATDEAGRTVESHDVTRRPTSHDDLPSHPEADVEASRRSNTSSATMAPHASGSGPRLSSSAAILSKVVPGRRAVGSSAGDDEGGGGGGSDMKRAGGHGVTNVLPLWATPSAPALILSTLLQ